MRQAAAQSNPTGTAESLELDLSFKFSPGEQSSALMEQLFEEEIDLNSDVLNFPSANLQDCQELLASNDWMLWFAFRQAVASKAYSSSEATLGPEGFFIKHLHYGSPFELQFLLPLLPPAGLAGLLYVTKRLYGFDLELKTYREKRRVEYLEAKQMADQISEADVPVAEVVRPPKRWELIRGILRDPSS